MDSILFPAVRLASSLRLRFSEPRLRQLLVWKLTRTLHAIGVRVGGFRPQFVEAPQGPEAHFVLETAR